MPLPFSFSCLYPLASPALPHLMLYGHKPDIFALPWTLSRSPPLVLFMAFPSHGQGMRVQSWVQVRPRANAVKSKARPTIPTIFISIALGTLLMRWRIFLKAQGENWKNDVFLY